MRGERFGFGEKRGAVFMFERGAIEAATHFEFCARKNGTKRVQFALEAAHVRNAERAKIEDGAGSFGDDIYASASFDDVGVYGDAAAQVVPLLNALELTRKFVNGVDAFLRREACMRGATVDDEFGLAYALASGLEQSAWAKGGLKYKDGIAAAGFGFDKLARGITANLFVRGPEKNQTVAERSFCLLQSFESEEGLHQAGFHIEDAGAIGFSAGDTEGHLG